MCVYVYAQLGVCMSEWVGVHMLQYVCLCVHTGDLMMGMNGNRASLDPCPNHVICIQNLQELHRNHFDSRITSPQWRSLASGDLEWYSTALVHSWSANMEGGAESSQQADRFKQDWVAKLHGSAPADGSRKRLARCPGALPPNPAYTLYARFPRTKSCVAGRLA